MGHDETEARQPYRNIAVKFYEGDYRYMLEMELTASGSWSQGSTWLVGIFDKQKYYVGALGILNRQKSSVRQALRL